MGKLDEVKEILNTLRVVLSLLFGSFVILSGAVVGRLEQGKLDVWTWVSVLGVFMLLGALFMVFRKIAERTKQIKDL